MVSSASVQVGLLAFALAIAAGLYSGNSATTVLSRALVAMVVGLVAARLAGGAMRLVLREYLQQKKYEIDRRYAEAEQEDQSGEVETAQPAEAG